MIPNGYDPIMLNHWLWFKYQCHECSPADFQRLFENIIKRARPEFMQIRPYGNIGDRKCDGLFLADSTVFQVYSPDELKLAEVQKKIDEDLDGAVEHWGDSIKTWVFVYNTRRGVAPDIPQMLSQKQAQYQQVKIDHMSSDALWETARGLSLQQRAEVLGAPAGYEHLFFSPHATPEEVRVVLDKSWFVLIQDTMTPVNLRAVIDALEPDIPFGAPIYIRPMVGPLPWTEAAEYQRSVIADVLTKSRDVHLPRFAVFSFAQIPLAIHLGFLLSDRIEIRCYQHDRDRFSWRWPNITPEEADRNIQLSGLPCQPIEEKTEVVIRVSLSSRISSQETNAIVPNSQIQVDIFVDNPDVMWLRHPAQLTKLGQTFRQVLAKIRATVPQCSRIHLFYAGPTGGAVVIGQQINPRMNPPVDLYQFSFQTIPRYQRAYTLTEAFS